MKFFTLAATALLISTFLAPVAFSQNPKSFHRLDLESGKEVRVKILQVSTSGDFAEFERKTTGGTKKFKLHLKAFNLDSSPNTKKPHLNQLTLESQQLVKKLVNKIAEKKEDGLSRQIRDSIWAEERLSLYKRKLGTIPKNKKDERRQTQAKIDTLEELAGEKAIIFGANKQYLPITELDDERQRADNIVSDWLASKDRNDKQRLQKLLQDNPLCLEAYLLLGLVLGAGDSEFDQAEKRFQKGCEVANRYFVSNQEISKDTDLDNYVRLLNNHAVFQIRKNNVKVAIKDWQKVVDLKRPLPSELTHNVAKILRMVKAKKGVELSKEDSRKLYEFAGNIGATSGQSGGWQIMLPLDLQKAPRHVGFLVGGKVRLVGNVISDHRCILCNGSGNESCQNQYLDKGNGETVPCRNGYFRVGHYATRIDPVSGLAVTRRASSKRIVCTACSGGGKVRCHICAGSGAQDN